ncbi:pyridoxamine 5'-phosphate oxidase family protein [Bacillus sp. CRN 9]|nr:pyridoxamine 5'-phosphate oxidase family protein [Bacillus sp. CRN 9]
MDKEDLKKLVQKIISNHQIGVLSSVENSKPHVRYMTFFMKDFILYTPTKKNTEKIEEIKNNPHVAALLGYVEKGSNDEYVEITGICSISEDKDLKEEFWNDSFHNWFNGADDPNYVLMEIKPEAARILNSEHMKTMEITL